MMSDRGRSNRRFNIASDQSPSCDVIPLRLRNTRLRVFRNTSEEAKNRRLSAEFEVNLGYFPLINETVTPSQCQVIDGLIYLQCENFPHIYPIPSQITGKILDGSTRAQSAYFLKKNIFQMYEKLIGACLENGSHWTLFFCDIPKRTIVYMNSFGESEVRKSAVLKNWSSFASARGCTGEWTLSHVSHPHQQDGNSCGVHVIMFAQSLIDGKTQVEEYNTEITKLRSN
ncbi:uncharacterized protein LOC143413426 isoform X3 [Maylandia zebra]|uniref:uncharacterized protein LOC143413426 isoform X3 n=1 Tax=Maylandia zebra TaxID=106582 RepID=UPI00403C80EC